MDTPISETKFNKFLNWLDPDRSSAAEKYENIRRGLIIVYSSRGCHESDQLADETINRVINKIDVLAETFVGNKEKYFFGVARNIYKEYGRRKNFQLNEEITVDGNPQTDHFALQVDDNLSIKCLNKCLEKIEENKKQIILDYFNVESGREKKYREQVAKKYSMTVNSLRVQMFRIKKDLYECIKNCLNQ